MFEQILVLENISKYYTSGGSVVAGLVDVNLSFSKGEFVAITGESGSGKSTLAHVLGGIIPYENGELYFCGSPTSHYDSTDWEFHRRDSISFISQNYGLLLGNTVFDNVLCALLLSGFDKAYAAEKTESILRRVELWECRYRRAAKLSSGQKQRLSIARALAKPSPILIADEPTGNLDPENSAKVISLLADAAKERLVILITHEFSEVEAYATRHITLRDGRVVTDAILRPFEEANGYADTTAYPRRKKKGLSLTVTRLSLRARPAWSLIMCLFFSLTAFTVFAFLGTFIVALDDTNTRIYDDSAFLNGDKRRIAVMRGDGGLLTNEDFEAILSVSHVESLERYGYIRDINIGYREGTDYDYKYHIEGGHPIYNPSFVQKESVILHDSGVFMQTVPFFSNEKGFLAAGRLPENIYEVVSADSDCAIGDTFPLFIKDSKSWGVSQYIRFDVTVVGTSDYGEGLYLHEDLGAMLSRTVLSDGMVYAPVYKNYIDGYCEISVSLSALVPTDLIFYRDYNDPDNIRHVSRVYDNKYVIRSPYGSTITLSEPVTESIFGVKTKWLGIVGTNQSTYGYYLGVSEEVFNKSIENYKLSDQASITITDYAFTDRVIKELGDLGYAALSPYKNGSTVRIPSLVTERLYTLIVCLISLLAVIVLKIIVARALFGLETESYRLLSDIGLSQKTAKRSILAQVLFFTVIGQLTGLSGILLCGHLGIERIVNLIKYLPIKYALILSAVHIIASLLTALLVRRFISRRVYRTDEKDSDLDRSVLREEAAHA